MKKTLTLSEAWVIFVKHPSPAVLLMIFMGFVGARLWVVEDPLIWQEALMVLGVMLYWPFQEWWMHRVLLHLKPIRIFGKEYEASFARIHRLHHEDPKDIPLSFLPLSVIFNSLILFTGLVYWFTSL